MTTVAIAARRFGVWWGGGAPRAATAGRHHTVAGVRARPRPGERRRARAIALGAVMVVGIALLLVWVRLQTVRTGYELSAARRLEHRLQQEQRELELEIATLTSPRRLERIARERLGMGPPTAGQIVSVP